jgi:hypothetical protein
MACHPRLGKHSPARILSLDLLKLILTWLPVEAVFARRAEGEDADGEGSDEESFRE